MCDGNLRIGGHLGGPSIEILSFPFPKFALHTPEQHLSHFNEQ